jgi:hypothetical protein
LSFLLRRLARPFTVVKSHNNTISEVEKERKAKILSAVLSAENDRGGS